MPSHPAPAPRETLDDLGDGRLVGADDPAQVLGVVAGDSPEGELLPRRVQECPVAVEVVRERSIGRLLQPGKLAFVQQADPPCQARSTTTSLI